MMGDPKFSNPKTNKNESHFCDVSSDHGWSLQDCPLLHVRVTSDALN